MKGFGLLVLGEWGTPPVPGFPDLSCGSGTAPIADALEATWQAGDFSQIKKMLLVK